MHEYKDLLGYLTVILGFISYVPYFRNILSGSTKPHAFSWLIWSILESIVFAVQVTEDAGAGAWVTASTALICFSVFVLALYKGSRTFDRMDWITLSLAFVAMVLWRVTQNPINALLLVIMADLLGYISTFRKAFHAPFEETASTYCIGSIKNAISIFALTSFTLATWLFPIYLTVINATFFIFLLIRRRAKHHIHHSIFSQKHGLQ